MTTGNPPSIFYTEESSYGTEPSIVPAPLADFFIEMQRPPEHIAIIELKGGLEWYNMIVIVDGEDITEEVITVKIKCTVGEPVRVTVYTEDEKIKGILKHE